MLPIRNQSVLTTGVWKIGLDYMHRYMASKHIGVEACCLQGCVKLCELVDNTGSGRCDIIVKESTGVAGTPSNDNE